MDRYEFHRVVRCLEAETQRSNAGVEGGTVGPRRSAVPSGSTFIGQPRGSFMSIGRETVSPSTLYQATPYGPRELPSTVLRARGHPIRSTSGRVELHELATGRTEHRQFQRPVSNLAGTLLPPSYQRSRSYLPNGTLSRRAERTGRVPTCYTARYRPPCPSQTLPGTIMRSLVGRPVIQFRGCSVDSDRAKTDTEMHRRSPPIVNLIDEETSSYSDSPTLRDGPSSVRPDPFTQGEPLNVVPLVKYGSDLRRLLAQPTARSSVGDPSGLCFSSNGLMQMEMGGPRSEQPDVVPVEPRAVTVATPMDLDSLSIAQHIRRNGVAAPVHIAPQMAAYNRLNMVSNVVYDLTQDDEHEIQPIAPLRIIQSRSGTSEQTDNPVVEQNSQSRVMDRLQPLLNAIDIVASQRDEEDPQTRDPQAALISPSASRGRLATVEPRKSGQNVRSLNDMAQEMSRKSTMQKTSRAVRQLEPLHDPRGDSDTESSWITFCGLKRMSPEGGASERNPYKKPYAKRRSLREMPEEEAPEPLWRFLHEGVRLAAPLPKGLRPLPPLTEGVLADGVCPSRSDSMKGVAVYPAREDMIWSNVQSWIEKRTQTQLQQCIERCTLCGLVELLLHASTN